jgi:hypothetical protein
MYALTVAKDGLKLKPMEHVARSVIRWNAKCL